MGARMRANTARSPAYDSALACRASCRATRTVTAKSRPTPGGTKHSTMVADSHAVATQRCSPTKATGAELEAPKLRPEMVTDTFPTAGTTAGATPSMLGPACNH